MSGKNSARKILGLTATAAVALTMVSAGGANAATGPKGIAEQLLKGSSVASATGAVRSARVAEIAAVESECTYKSYAPNKIVLGASTVKAKFSVNVTGCTPLVWGVGLDPFLDPNGETDAGIAWNDTPTISLSPRVLRNTDAGKHASTEVVVIGEDDDYTNEDYLPLDKLGQALTLQRRATFGSTFNASEPVKKGKNITIKAKLARINWNGAKTLKYIAYGKAKAQLQFKADGTTSYKTIKTVTGASNGTYSTTVKATKTGRWRLVFAGVSTTSPATSTSDAVKVTS